MAVPAYCSNCSPSSANGQGKSKPANLGVVMGVLGGLALVGLLVAIIVPLVRLRRRRGTVASTRADEESVRRSAGRLDSRSGPRSRRSSFRHQKNLFGPDALLPLVTPVSTFAWSDIRPRSPGTDDDSLDEAETYSFPTAGATTSHLGPGEESYFAFGADIMGGRGADATRTSLPSPNRSPTPPGLPSKYEDGYGYAPSASKTFLTTTTSRTAMGESSSAEATLPPTPVSPVAPLSRNMSRVKPAMPPVMEDSPGSRPQSLQLPSPPSSPDQLHAHWRTSSRRPTLTANHSAPTTLPFRPRSSTVTGPTTTSLTSAFQAPLAYSSSASTTATDASMSQRYPSLTAPPSQSRSRASSASIDMNALPKPHGPRPVDTSRRTSTTDIRYRHASRQPQDPESLPPPSQPSHAPDSLRTSRYLAPSSSATHQRAQPTHTASDPTFTTPPPAPLSPPAQSATPPRGSATYSRSPDASRAGPSNVVWRQPTTQQQPALVRRKDSLALRPLAMSPFVHSPPHNPSAYSPPSGPSVRSRSGSIRSVRTERSVHAHIPPFDPLPPLHLDSNFDSSSRRSSKVPRAPNEPAS